MERHEKRKPEYVRTGRPWLLHLGSSSDEVEGGIINDLFRTEGHELVRCVPESEPCPLAVAFKSPRYDGLGFPGPTRVVFFQGWRRIIIIQKEIPRMGSVCVVGVGDREAIWA